MLLVSMFGQADIPLNLHIMYAYLLKGETYYEPPPYKSYATVEKLTPTDLGPTSSAHIPLSPQVTGPVLSLGFFVLIVLASFFLCIFCSYNRSLISVDLCRD